MIRLRALGTVDLRGDDGGEIRSVLMQPKRLALFAYVALARPRGFQRRDTLIGVFWPDQAPERARPALNQAVHVLRRSLGADVLVGRGADELAVAPERVECDLWELESALAAGDPARAVELYRGELLTGLVVPDAGEFERWLDNERKHWSGRVLQALRELTDRTEGAGDLTGAVGWARRTLDHSPYDEPALVRLMQLLARRGDRAAAIQACERFSDRLWNDVELRLSPATREVLSRIKREAGLAAEGAVPGAGATPSSAAPTGAAAKEGAAPAAATPQVHPAAGAAAPAGAAAAHAVAAAAADQAAPASETANASGSADAQPPIAGKAGRHRLRLAAFLALGLIATGALGAGMVRLLRPPRARLSVPGASLQPTRVAVMYFDETDPAQHLRPLADGLTEELINRLSQLQVDGLYVVSRNGVRFFRGTSVPLDSIRKVLGTPLLISGSVSRSGDHVRVYVQLVDAATGNTLRSQQLEGRGNEPFALIDTLSESVSGFLRQALGREIKLNRAHAGTADVQAWNLYRRGEAAYFQAADEDDRGFREAARAHLAEADSLFVLAAKEDPAWTEPVLARAVAARLLALEVLTGDGGPTAALERLGPARDAVEMALVKDPDNARVLEQAGLLGWYASIFSPRAHTRDSLVATAGRELRRAVELDPERADAWSTLSALDLDAGRLTAAKADAARAYEADAYLMSAAEVLNRLFSSSFELHQDTDARKACNETERRFGQVWYQAYCALMLMAWTDRHIDPDRAWRTYDAPSRIDSPETRARTRPMLAMLLAATLARAGMPDSARHIATRARAEAPTDPEVMRLEAAARLLVGDSARARALIAAYTRDRSPGRLAAVRGRMFQPLSLPQGQ